MNSKFLFASWHSLGAFGWYIDWRSSILTNTEEAREQFLEPGFFFNGFLFGSKGLHTVED